MKNLLGIFAILQGIVLISTTIVLLAFVSSKTIKTDRKIIYSFAVTFSVSIISTIIWRLSDNSYYLIGGLFYSFVLGAIVYVWLKYKGIK